MLKQTCDQTQFHVAIIMLVTLIILIQLSWVLYQYTSQGDIIHLSVSRPEQTLWSFGSSHVVEKNTYCMLHMLFKSFEDVIVDERDSLWSCFVTTAKWYLPKTKNLFISPNWICPFTSSYWTVCEFFNLLLAMLVQVEVHPFTTALWYVSTWSPGQQWSILY